MNEKLISRIKEFVSAHDLPNTKKLLADYEEHLSDEELTEEEAWDLNHGLSVCKLLIDLEIDDASDAEIDSAFAAGLLHTAYEIVNISDELLDSLDGRVFVIADYLDNSDVVTEDDRIAFYDKIRGDAGALLVLLADRATTLATLYQLPLEESRTKVRETRIYFFSLCIYAMENFPTLYHPINILKGKIKGLCEVYDILTDHFQAREQELSVEILRVQEDNARLRTRIKAMQEL